MTKANTSPSSNLDLKPHPKLLEQLVCPISKGLLRYDPDHDELVTVQGRRAYPIRLGVPILLPEEARPL